MKSIKYIPFFLVILTLAGFAVSSSTSRAANAVFRIIVDNGESTFPYESEVANRIKSWNPDFIVTAGDNN